MRDGDRWWLTTVPVTVPVPTDLVGALALVASVAATESPTGALVAPGVQAVDEPLPVEEHVAPVWAWVGEVTPAGVLLEGNEGVVLVLDEDDLRLLDALHGPTSVGDLARMTGVGDAPVRLARLAAAGRVERRGSWIEPPPVAAPVEPARGRPPVPPSGGDGRIGVHAVWQERVGPALSLGMLTASARAWHDAALCSTFDIRRPETADEVLASLASGSGPAVLLCSNYVWSLEHNLDVAREAKVRRPGLVVIHGGPSTPKYPADATRFLAEHRDVADVLVRGEGEVTLCRVLDSLAGSLPDLDGTSLARIDGLTFRDPRNGEVVRTPDPERLAALDELPSPYLTGEFDHIDPAAWLYSASVETNRGCPYGCTFCDWGSATLSRIRKFPVARVLAELEWLASHGISGVQICDANFGIMSRDVEIAEGLAAVRRRHGLPRFFSFTPAKNTTRHVTRILDAAVDSGLLVSTAISLQTVDEATLAAVERSNISTQSYLALAAELRRRGLPLQGDLLIGMPGQTYESYKADLQFFVDHQIAPRSWSLRALPNAPMNEPSHRARHQIRTDRDAIVTSTSTMSPEQRARMLALRKAQVIADQYGVLIHVLRFLQWDHDLAATDVLEHVLDVTRSAPERFPLVTWLLEHFDLHATAPRGWSAFYAEVRRLVAEDFGLDPAAGDLDTVLRVQAALMPAPLRAFPDRVDLAHDYEAYHREATASLFASGAASAPSRPLASFPPSTFTVEGDPLGLCRGGLRFEGDSRDESMLGQFWIGVGSSHELHSELTRVAPEFRNLDLADGVAGLEVVPEHRDPVPSS